MRKSRSRRNGLEVFCERRSGRIVGLEVRGHAGFAGAGDDIVCAAVSVLVLTAAEGLKAYCRARIAVSDQPSLYRLDVVNGGDERAQAVLETAIGGLEAIAASYPRNVAVYQVTNRGGRTTARTGRHSPQEKTAARPR